MEKINEDEHDNSAEKFWSSFHYPDFEQDSKCVILISSSMYLVDKEDGFLETSFNYDKAKKFNSRASAQRVVDSLSGFDEIGIKVVCLSSGGK